MGATQPLLYHPPLSQLAPSNTAQRVDEEFSHQLMPNVQNQLDVIIEGIGPTDHALRDYLPLASFCSIAKARDPGL